MTLIVVILKDIDYEGLYLNVILRYFFFVNDFEFEVV